MKEFDGCEIDNGLYDSMSSRITSKGDISNVQLLYFSSTSKKKSVSTLLLYCSSHRPLYLVLTSLTTYSFIHLHTTSSSCPKFGYEDPYVA